MDRMDHLILDSTNHASDHGSPATGKKRKAGASGRGVASLTPEQLAKKRANDRDAQRAIRERTKATIETLEQKIQELTSQHPYQELQAVIRQKEAIQAENDEIRRRLASILSIIQPVVGAQGLTDLATAASHNIQLGFTPTSNNVFQQDQYLNNGQSARSYHSPNLSTGDASSYAAPFGTSEQDQSNDNRVWSSSRDALNQQRDNLQRSLELNESGERLSFNFLLDGVNNPHFQQTKLSTQQQAASFSSPLDTSPSRNNNANPLPQSYTLHHQHDPTQHQSQSVFTMLPKNCAPTCPLDGVLLNFLQDRKRNPSIPPAYPSVSSLLNPASTTTIDPLSQLMTDLISKFPNISGLPEQVATLFIMFLFMRWQIYPTAENYERLPEWMTPRPSQLFTSHPAWIDHIPWPRMRDKVIANYTDYPFENWFLPFTSGMNVNWPYEPVDCLLSTPAIDVVNQSSSDAGVPASADATTAGGAGGEAVITTMNPVFERHIRRLENWSLGPQFADSFPGLVDTTTIRGRNSGFGGQSVRRSGGGVV